MKQKTALRISAICLLFCLFFSGCGSGFFYPDFLETTPTPTPEPTEPPIILPGQKPGVNAFGIPFYPVESFQPLRDSYRYNAAAAKLCYEGLVELDPDFTPQPVIAADIRTEDNITYTVTLRQDVRFWDGSPLTAGDVVYSYNQARTEGGPYTERLKDLAAVTLSEGAVVFTMSRPVFGAVSLLDIPIVQQHSDGEISVGTGPYSVHLDGEDTFLVQNENWWRSKGKLPISRIELIPVENPGDLALQFGQTFISLMPMDVYDTLAPGIAGNCDKARFLTPVMQYIGFNAENELLAKPEIRKAISLAIDRESMVETLYGDFAEPAALPMPSAAQWYDETAALPTNADPDTAALLLEEQGLTDRDDDGIRELKQGWRVEPVVLRMVASAGNNTSAEAAEMVVDALRAVGLEVDLQMLSWDAFLKVIQEGEYDIYYTEALLAPNFPVRELAMEEGVLNPGGIHSPELTEAIELLEAATSAEQKAALTEVYRLFGEQTPCIPICFRKMQVYSQFGLIEGLNPTYYNPYYDWEKVTINNRQ